MWNIYFGIDSPSTCLLSVHGKQHTSLNQLVPIHKTFT